MKFLDVVAERNGKVLGTITLDGSNAKFSSTDVEAIFRSAAFHRGGTVKAFADLTNSSNGYISFRPR